MAHEALAEWPEGEQPFRMSARMDAGEDAEFDEIDDLPKLGQIDPDRVRELKLHSGSFADVPSVRIDASVEELVTPVVELRVVGHDEARVLGLASKLKRELDAGKRFPGWYQRWHVFLYLFVPLTLSIVANNLFGRQRLTNMVLIAAVLLLAALALATPSLELLPPGRKTRAARVYRVLGGSVATLALGVLATAIYEAVFR